MEKQVLLQVKNLEQHFKMGKRTLKAVNDISFDIYQGEVFGLVGESGCGKTTTGRSIIKLYNITSGSVFFKGTRICAGVGHYRKQLVDLEQGYRQAVKTLRAEAKQAIAGGSDKILVKLQTKEKTLELKAELNESCQQVMAEMKQAKFEHRNCNKIYGKQQAEKVYEQFEGKIASASGIASDELIKQRNKEIKLAKKDRIMNKMQMIFQDPIASLDPRMTVREIIAEGFIIRGITDKQFIDEQVFKVLDLVGLVPEHANRYPHEFSGGQRQRIGIARAVILGPEMIIADEPISALDVSIQAQVINLLNELRKTLGLTIMFIAHDLSVVKYFSDRIAVMYFGKIVELATSDELFANPLHPYTKSLLSAIPVPDPRIEKSRKRVEYHPEAEHDYSSDLPTMHEVTKGHFVYCNEAELKLFATK